MTAPTTKWTDSGCKALHSWEDEGQQFHSKHSSEHSWAEEGNDPGGKSIRDPGENARIGSQVTAQMQVRAVHTICFSNWIFQVGKGKQHLLRAVHVTDT